MNSDRFEYLILGLHLAMVLIMVLSLISQPSIDAFVSALLWVGFTFWLACMFESFE